MTLSLKSRRQTTRDPVHWERRRQRGRRPELPPRGWRRWTRWLNFSSITGSVALLISIYNFYTASIYSSTDFRIRIIDSNIFIDKEDDLFFHFEESVSVANVGNKPGILQRVTFVIRSKPNPTCEETYKAYRFRTRRLHDTNEWLSSYDVPEGIPVPVGPGELKLISLGPENDHSDSLSVLKDFPISPFTEDTILPPSPITIGCIVFSVLDYKNQSKDIVFETTVDHYKTMTSFHIENVAKSYAAN